MTFRRDSFVEGTTWGCTKVHPSQQDHVVSLPDVNFLLANKNATFAVQRNADLTAINNELYYCLYNQHSGPFAFDASVNS